MSISFSPFLSASSLFAAYSHVSRTNTDSPGFNINFESAPFKLTREYIDIMGGVDSEDFKAFQDLFLRGFLALQKHIDGVTSIIQVCVLCLILVNMGVV